MKKLLAGLTLSSALLLAACGSDDAAETPTDGGSDDAVETPADGGSDDAVETPADGGSDDAVETPAEGGLQDGTYALEELNFGDTGWKESLEIVVAGGEITDATFTSLDEEGNNKLEDDGYQDAMLNVVEVGPQDFIPALEDSLVDTQNPDDVEVVTGATSTSEKFKDYADQLVAAAEEGNTDTIEVDNQEE